MIPNKIKVWRGWWKEKQLSKTLAVLLRPNTPEPVSAFTIKSWTLFFFSFPKLWAKYKPDLNVIDHTDADWLDRYLCTASIKPPLVCYFDVPWKWCIMKVIRVYERSLHGMIWSTRFFFMLAGRFPVLMFSFIIRTLVSFWWERTRVDWSESLLWSVRGSTGLMKFLKLKMWG